MQQADGWQNPEALIYKTEIYKAEIGKAEIGLDAGSQLGSVPESPSSYSSNHSSSYLPWLETVAPPNSGRDDQSLAGSGLIPQLRPPNPAENLAVLIHDARNMVAAMDLYCDLLEEPGVLSAPFRHYAGELRLVGGASRRLLEKLALLDLASDGAKGRAKSALAEGGTEISLESLLRHTLGPFTVTSPASTSPALTNPASLTASNPGPVPQVTPEGQSHSRQPRFFQFGEPIQDLAEDLLASQNLLSAIAGPGVKVALSISGGHRPIAMAGDDLTRVLVNLCRNAVEAMPDGGHIQIALAENREENGESLLLTFTDNGPGIPEAALEAIFSSGFTSHGSLSDSPFGNQSGRPVSATGAASTAWPTQHRGLGLAIVRSLVSAAGGSVWAANRKGNPETGGTAQTGAVIFLEFPLRDSYRGT